MKKVTFLIVLLITVVFLTGCIPLRSNSNQNTTDQQTGGNPASDYSADNSFDDDHSYDDYDDSNDTHGDGYENLSDTYELMGYSMSPNQIADLLNYTLTSWDPYSYIPDFYWDYDTNGNPYFESYVTSLVTVYIFYDDDYGYTIGVDYYYGYTEYESEEFYEQADIFLNVCAAIVANLDPDTDVEALFDELNMYSLDEESVSAQSEWYYYFDITDYESKSFFIAFQPTDFY